MNKKSAIGLISAVLITTLASGCKESPAVQSAVTPETAVQPAAPVIASTTEPPTAPVKDSVIDPAVPAPAVPPQTGNDKVATASSDQSAKPDNGSAAHADTKPPASKPKIEIKSPYTEAKPTLLGLSLKTKADEISSRFGKPKEQFLMEEDTDPITVYDYTDFLIGFNNRNELQFIDVRSADIDPGLNGLRLGDPVSEVQQALGKPDSNTSLVLTYKASGAILKLDIDPKTQKINSIKLFGQ